MITRFPPVIGSPHDGNPSCSCAGRQVREPFERDQGAGSLLATISYAARVSAFRLGIDYGTSNTVAMLRWPDGRTRPLLFDSSPLLPSAVYLTPEGTLLSGRDAQHSTRLDRRATSRIPSGTSVRAACCSVATTCRWYGPSPRR
ncbi:hypothetical protein NUM_03330 [Actinocatenispora comari]|uniref:Hsp70 family protein n=1 Tax=Actinocatenispora comari TaxID=2807577 RepID=A0A8J4A6C0_9ACTN|nr:hypothetical protein NUM_03330 [Actinocatenispora comari]